MSRPWTLRARPVRGERSAVSVPSNPVRRCDSSQNGFVDELPHRQSPYVAPFGIGSPSSTSIDSPNSVLTIATEHSGSRPWTTYGPWEVTSIPGSTSAPARSAATEESISTIPGAYRPSHVPGEGSGPSRKPTILCEPSQTGWDLDAPHRHREIRSTGATTGRSVSIGTPPATRTGPSGFSARPGSPGWGTSHRNGFGTGPPPCGSSRKQPYGGARSQSGIDPDAPHRQSATGC